MMLPHLVIANSDIKYLAADQEEVQNDVAIIRKSESKEPLRSNAIKIVEGFYDRHKIAIGMIREGGRRTFQSQYDIRRLRPGSTGAGPGESNHNYGEAIDLGFKGLKWLHPNGDVETREDSWLRRLEAIYKGKSKPFWE